MVKVKYKGGGRMKYIELKGKSVLITGGTQGIGSSIAKAFTLSDAKVAINGRKLNDKVQKVLDETGAIAVVGDLSDVEKAKGIVNDVVAQNGGIDVLVANAAGMNMKPFLEQDEMAWKKQIEINLSGHLFCIQECIKHMKDHGGTIVVISSFFGSIGWNNATGYGASKSGLLNLGQYLARDYKKYNINVCILIPGVIDTDQLNVDAQDLGISLDEVREMYAETLPINRVGQPSEIAEMVCYMATEKGGRALSGKHVQVSGGEYRTTPYYL